MDVGDRGELYIAGVEGLDGEVGVDVKEGSWSKWSKRSFRIASSLLTISVMRPRSTGSSLGGASSSSWPPASEDRSEKSSTPTSDPSSFSAVSLSCSWPTIVSNGSRSNSSACSCPAPDASSSSISTCISTWVAHVYEHPFHQSGKSRSMNLHLSESHDRRSSKVDCLQSLGSNR